MAILDIGSPLPCLVSYANNSESDTLNGSKPPLSACGPLANETLKKGSGSLANTIATPPESVARLRAILGGAK